VGGDLALPETRGDRPRGIGLTNAYVDPGGRRARPAGAPPTRSTAGDRRSP
jgi:hypothetical protein